MYREDAAVRSARHVGLAADRTDATSTAVATSTSCVARTVRVPFRRTRPSSASLCATWSRPPLCATSAMRACTMVRFSANAPLTLQSMCFRSCTSRSRTVCRALSTPTLCVCARAPTAASARRRACASAVTPASRTRLLPRLLAGTVPNCSVSKPGGVRSAAASA